jgi:hypothetical protein
MSLSRRAVSPWTADYNGDGYSDLLFYNQSQDSVAVWTMVGTQLVTGARIGSLPHNAGFLALSPGDLNGDGTSDLLTGGGSPYSVSAWLTHGTQPASVTPVVTVTGNGGWYVAGGGDFNGDGQQDILFSSGVPNAQGRTPLAVGLMNGTQLITTVDVGGVDTAQGWMRKAVDDFNGDGTSDFMFFNQSTHNVALWLMKDAKIQSTPILGNVNTAGGWDLAPTGPADFNGDGKADLLFLNSITHGVAVWLTDGNQITAAGQAGILNPAWHFLDVGDFNGDGKSDILFQNDSTGGVAVWLMNGTEVITGAQVGTIAAGSSYTGPGQGLADLNGDHKSDILFQNTTTGAVTAWLMDGTHVTVNQQIGTIDLAQGWHLI